MTQTKLTVEQRVERCHVQLMKDPNYCLFSGVFMVGKVSIKDDPFLTAATNGRDVVYGRQFMERLNDKQINFVVIHEAMHKAYRHLTTWKSLSDENHALANCAMDYVINLQIVEGDAASNMVEFPTDEHGERMGLYDEQYRGMDTKQVYELLKKKCKEIEGDKPRRGQDGQPDGPSDRLGPLSRMEQQQHDTHDWDGAITMDEKEREELTRDIDHALREGAILAGKFKGNVPRGIDELLHPKVDWRAALRDFLKSAMLGRDQTTWRRPNRRFIGMDIIMSTMISEKAHMFVNGIDASGSITGEPQTQFVSEVNAICNELMPEVMEVLYWDSHVAGHETYKGSEVSNFSTMTKPIGGGGTNPDCVAKYVREKNLNPQAIIMLTDGVFYEHDPQAWVGLAPVLWCVIGNKYFVPKTGAAVYIE